MASIPSENGVDGDDEREEEEEEVEEYGDEVEEEPRLKYQRMGGNVPALLSNDAASCIAVAARMIALGTHDGTVHILDFLGNQVKEFRDHTATVNDLNFDSEGEYIGSCSDDGYVVINSLFTDDEKMKFDYDRPMKAIALDPDYTKTQSKRFVAGGLAGHLYMNSKKWFGFRDQVLHSGEGPIHSVKWREVSSPGLMMLVLKFMIQLKISVLHLLKDREEASGPRLCFRTWFGRFIKLGNMGDFSIQISSKLINQLSESNDQPKRRAKKTKPKVSPKRKEEQPKTFQDAEKPNPKAELPMQPPFFFPIPQQAAGNTESEKVLEKLELQEKNIVDKVTERAKDLREKEFKIPEPKPMPCASDHEASMKCYKENIDNPLKCAGLVRSFQECARRFRQQVNREVK